MNYVICFGKHGMEFLSLSLVSTILLKDPYFKHSSWKSIMLVLSLIYKFDVYIWTSLFILHTQMISRKVIQFVSVGGLLSPSLHQSLSQIINTYVSVVSMATSRKISLKIFENGRNIKFNSGFVAFMSNNWAAYAVGCHHLWAFWRWSTEKELHWHGKWINVLEHNNIWYLFVVLSRVELFRVRITFEFHKVEYKRVRVIELNFRSSLSKNWVEFRVSFSQYSFKTFGTLCSVKVDLKNVVT